MISEEQRTQIEACLGGSSNLSSWREGEASLLLRVKDQSLVQTEDLALLPFVRSVRLNMGTIRLDILGKEETVARDQARRRVAGFVLELVGGVSNVEVAERCLTRLRLSLRDPALADLTALESLPQVMAAVLDGSECQLVVPDDAAGILGELRSSLRVAKPSQACSGGESALRLAKALASAVLPVVITALTLRLALVSMTGTGLVDAGSDFAWLLDWTSDAGLRFLPLVAAWACADALGANVAMALFLTAVMLHPTLTDLSAQGASLSLGLMRLPAISYAYDAIPAMALVFVQRRMEVLLDRLVPTNLRYLLHPLLTLLLTLAAGLCLIAPVCAAVRQALALVLAS